MNYDFLKGHNVVLFRARAISVRLVLLVVLSALIAGCDEVERHKVLTFFFDGVPLSRREELKEELVGPNSGELGQMRPKQLWYAHEPRKDCTLCHGKRRQVRFSHQIDLVAPVPELCYGCHTDYTVSASFVHGPVSVGQCLFCHNPHASKIEHLLKEPVPKLCYLCHNINAIELIPAHLTEPISACTDCHDAHTSSAKALLKVAPSQPTEEPDGAKGNLEKVKQEKSVSEGKPEEPPAEPGRSKNQLSEQMKEIAKLYYRSMTSYRAGQLVEAREGFVEVLKSGLVPPPMAKTIRGYLLDIDNTLAKRESR